MDTTGLCPALPSYGATLPVRISSPGFLAKFTRRSRMTAESSVELLARARTGDDRALEELLARHVPALRRWARGRLPRWARDMAETEDLVQDTVLRSLRNQIGRAHV